MGQITKTEATEVVENLLLDLKEKCDKSHKKVKELAISIIQDTLPEKIREMCEDEEMRKFFYHSGNISIYEDKVTDALKYKSSFSIYFDKRIIMPSDFSFKSELIPKGPGTKYDLLINLICTYIKEKEEYGRHRDILVKYFTSTLKTHTRIIQEFPHAEKYFYPENKSPNNRNSEIEKIKRKLRTLKNEKNQANVPYDVDEDQEKI